MEKIVTSNLVGSKKRFACQDAKEADPCNSKNKSSSSDPKQDTYINGKSMAYRSSCDQRLKSELPESQSSEYKCLNHHRQTIHKVMNGVTEGPLLPPAFPSLQQQPLQSLLKLPCKRPPLTYIIGLNSLPPLVVGLRF